MSRVFYTSDLHIGHKLVAGIRGYDSAEDHDSALVEMWSSTVTDSDTVYVLGDVAVSGFHTYVLPLIDSLPGIKHLISGNHDPVHPMHRTAAAQMGKFLDVFKTVTPFTRRRVDGHEFLLSHFPYASWGDGEARPGSRFEQYRLPDMGMPLLHGHTHGTEKAHGHSFHVGLDAWRGLVPQETVATWLSELEAAS